MGSNPIDRSMLTEAQRQEILTGYRWIRVKRWVDDESLSWEERFTRLREHHDRETNFLINFIRRIIGA